MIINCIKNNKMLTLIIAWIIADFILLFIYLGIYGNVTWVVLTGFATWILAGGVFFTFIQIREARKSTNAQIAVEFFRELRSDKALEILRFIYRLNPEADLQTLCSSDLHNIDYVLDRFDFLAVLVRKGVVDKELAVDPYAGVSALRCWRVLYRYIYKVRDKRKYFGYNFEAFTNCCMEYFHDAGIEVGFDNPYVPDEDLVKEFKNLEKEKDEAKRKLYPRTLEKIKEEINLKSSK